MNTTLVERLLLYAFIVGAVLYFALRKPTEQSSDVVSVVVKYDSVARVIDNSKINTPVVVKLGDMTIPPAELKLLHQTQDTGLLKQVLHEVLLRYYGEYVQHTTNADTNIIIDTWDTLTENGIVGRKLQYKWIAPISKETTIVQQRGKFYVGGRVEAGSDGWHAANICIAFSPKKDKGIVAIDYNAYNLLSGKNKLSFGISYYHKISLKKK